ncbi:MAG: hypothetical protein ABEJ95_07060 [Candidatus Nanohalobium sp.]
MGLETDYMEYGIELSLSVLGVSAAYFVDFSQPVTLLGLLFLPLLYGYTAYISSDGFSRASLVSLSSLIFAVVGGFTAVTAVMYGLGNVFVSVFSGNDFRSFYSSTSLPLLLTGLVLGSALFLYGSAHPSFKQQKLSDMGQDIGETAQDTFGSSKMVQGQKDAQLRLVNSTSRLSSRLMVRKVMNYSDPSTEVREALVKAEKEVPDLVYRRVSEEFNSRELDISSKIESLFVETFSGSRFFLVVPFVTAAMFGLQPVLGLLTALAAKMFQFLDR